MKRPPILFPAARRAVHCLPQPAAAPGAGRRALKSGGDGGPIGSPGAPGFVQMSAAYAAPAALEEVPADIAVPDSALANPEEHAAAIPDYL